MFESENVLEYFVKVLTIYNHMKRYDKKMEENYGTKDLTLAAK